MLAGQHERWHSPPPQPFPSSHHTLEIQPYPTYGRALWSQAHIGLSQWRSRYGTGWENLDHQKRRLSWEVNYVRGQSHSPLRPGKVSLPRSLFMLYVMNNSKNEHVRPHASWKDKDCAHPLRGETGKCKAQRLGQGGH